jgi:hypothetical protein
MTEVRLSADATRADMYAIVAEAHIALSTEAPATTGVYMAIAQLERLLPPSGTPEYREAFRTAHLRRGDSRCWAGVTQP